MNTPPVEVLLPIHNEAATIEATLHEICAAVSPVVPMRFLLCEDGSTDSTPGVLERLTAELPIRLLTGKERKGYSRAVVDGFRKIESPWVLFMDSDGQIDPAAFALAWSKRDSHHVVIGWRVQRFDAFHRRFISRAFRIVYRLLFHVPLQDPSCPFLLIQREVVRALVDDLAVLKQGFWWEFTARVHGAGYRVAEIPITHRERAAGRTQIYSWRRIPGIAWSHLTGLFLIKRQLRQVHERHQATP